MLYVMNGGYINALMNIYTSFSAYAWCYNDGVQTQSPLEFRHVGGEDLIVDMVKAELALFLSLDDVCCSKLFQMMRDGGLGDFEEGVNVRAVQFPCHCQLLQYCATLRVG